MDIFTKKWKVYNYKYDGCYHRIVSCEHTTIFSNPTQELANYIVNLHNSNIEKEGTKWKY